MFDAEELEKLKTELADSAAKADIESNAMRDGDGWYDLAPLVEEDVDFIETAVRYLTLRGLLERHPDRADQVRIRK